MLVRTAEEISGEWLADVLGKPALEVKDIERIGTGQMSHSHRVRFGADAELALRRGADDGRRTGGGGQHQRDGVGLRDVAQATHQCVGDHIDGAVNFRRATLPKVTVEPCAPDLR